MPSRPRSLPKGRNEDLPRHLRRMAAIKPDLHASESPEGRSLRMQGCGKDWQPFNDDIATWQRPTRGDLTCPRPSQPRVVRRRGLPPRGVVRGPRPLPRTCLVPDHPPPAGDPSPSAKELLALATSRARPAYARRPLLTNARSSYNAGVPAAPAPLTRNSRCCPSIAHPTAMDWKPAAPALLTQNGRCCPAQSKREVARTRPRPLRLREVAVAGLQPVAALARGGLACPRPSQPRAARRHGAPPLGEPPSLSPERGREDSLPRWGKGNSPQGGAQTTTTTRQDTTSPQP